MGWFDSVEHNRWLSAQMRALLQEAQGAIVPTGFAHLTPRGGADLSRGIDLAVTARMTYVFSLGVLMGIPGCRRYADHGVHALATYFADPDNGGWWTAIRPEPDEDGHGIPFDEESRWKSQFRHAFLILGASAATVANRPGALELLVDALHDQERHWLQDDGLPADTFTPDYAQCTNRRSMDALVHTAEAYLNAAEATTDPVWVERAEVMAAFVHHQAADNEWRIPEYYDAQWQPVSGAPEGFTDGRRVYEGAVIGHSFQWARLAVHIRAALRSMGRPQPDYLTEMGQELFERARVDGWRRNGRPGFALSVDPAGFPLMTDHLQWVACEGVCAAVALRRALLDDGGSAGDVEHYEHSYRAWLDYVNDHLIAEPGRWIRALDADNEPIEAAVSSRSDVYHAIQTLLMARVPLWPPFASAISRDLLDHPQEPPTDRKTWNLFHRRRPVQEG